MDVHGMGIQQVVVDCRMLSKVLAVITLMCHFCRTKCVCLHPLAVSFAPFSSVHVCVCSYFIQHVVVIQMLRSRSHSLATLDFFDVCRHFAKLISGLFS